VPECMVPFVPIRDKGEEAPFVMLRDLQLGHPDRVFDVSRYPSVDRLTEVLDAEIFKPAQARFAELLARRGYVSGTFSLHGKAATNRCGRYLVNIKKLNATTRPAPCLPLASACAEAMRMARQAVAERQTGRRPVADPTLSKPRAPRTQAGKGVLHSERHPRRRTETGDPAATPRSSSPVESRFLRRLR
jgi:hypothetical protein